VRPFDPARGHVVHACRVRGVAPEQRAMERRAASEYESCSFRGRTTATARRP
jgi:hypothetical protein